MKTRQLPKPARAIRRAFEADDAVVTPRIIPIPIGRLVSKVGVDGAVFRRQHMQNATLPPATGPQIVWGLNVRFDGRFRGCYITSTDPAHRNLSHCPRLAQQGLFTAYRNHRPLASHRRLEVCRRALLTDIARTEFQGDFSAFLHDVQHPRAHFFGSTPGSAASFSA